MAKVRVDGIGINYEIDGASDDAILLLHPVGLDLTWWQPHAERFAAHFKVVRIDFRGHGGSDVVDSGYGLHDLAADVRYLLKHLALQPVHVLGHSLGGMIAQLLAIEHPDYVRSLLLSGTTSTLSPETRTIMESRARAAEVGGMTAVVEPTLERWFTSGFLTSETVRRCRERLLANDVRAWAATWRAIAGLHTYPRLREIRARTLVLTGDADVSTTVGMAGAIAEQIPNSALTVIKGGPHMAPYEMPEAFISEVLRFLRPARATEPPRLL